MVLLFFDTPLGTLKSIPTHTRALNIKSHLRWRKRTDTMDMRLNWVRVRINHKQLRVYRPPGMKIEVITI